MVSSSRLRQLAKTLDDVEPEAGLSPVQLAADLAGMAMAIECPDPEHQARREAKAARLREAVTSGDSSGLLPGDLEVKPPSEMIACE